MDAKFEVYNDNNVLQIADGWENFAVRYSGKFSDLTLTTETYNNNFSRSIRSITVSCVVGLVAVQPSPADVNRCPSLYDITDHGNGTKTFRFLEWFYSDTDLQSKFYIFDHPSEFISPTAGGMTLYRSDSRVLFDMGIKYMKVVAQNPFTTNASANAGTVSSNFNVPGKSLAIVAMTGGRACTTVNLGIGGYSISYHQLNFGGGGVGGDINWSWTLFDYQVNPGSGLAYEIIPDLLILDVTNY